MRAFRIVDGDEIHRRTIASHAFEDVDSDLESLLRFDEGRRIDALEETDTDGFDSRTQTVWERAG